MVELLERPAPARPRARLAVVPVVVVAVICCDQVSKAWGWRHAARAHVNSGGTMMLSPSVSGWLRDPVVGAVFDVLDTVALAAALVLLIRRPRARLMLASLTLVLAGCISNLGDRLGLHYLTAPGSRRGVIDFIHFWGRLWNVADLAILTGSAMLAPALLASTLGRRVRRDDGRAVVTGNPLAHRTGRRVVGVGLTLTAALAAIGAVACSGADAPGLFAGH
jgi:lipoprotein signal peptidase